MNDTAYKGRRDPVSAPSSGITYCPDCGKLIAIRFPIHTSSRPRGKRQARPNLKKKTTHKQKGKK